MEEKRFAVLIDADNVSSKYIKFILDEISNYGVATYKRIYGDWTKASSTSWKDILLENSVTPIQQYGYTVGKNATDSAMIIDAMDILYSGNVEGFSIISSDSDFTKLAARLRESGMMVVGMGERKTPKPFIAACNQFKYLDVLAETEKSLELEESQAKKKKAVGNEKNNKPDAELENMKAAKPSPEEIQEQPKYMTDISIIESTVLKMMNEIDSDAQRMNMGELGSRLVKRYPDFDVRNYGDTKLSKFLRKFDFLEINSDGKGGSSMWVSLKTDEEGNPVQKASEKKQTYTKRKRTYRKRG